MIAIKDLSFQYKGGKRLALSDINLNIAAGSFVGIIGSSGAGKSTLTRALNGIIPHYFTGDFYGSVEIEGMDTITSTPAQLSRLVGSVFQDIDGQMVASVVEDELLFGLENFAVPRAEIASRVQEALAMVGISNLRQRSLATLSGGQRQKVAIAAIIALKPRILVLDEPTAELDPHSSRLIFEMLKQLKCELGMTIVVVEQKIMLLSEYVDRLIVMHNGSIAFAGEVRSVLAQAAELRALGVNIPRIATLAENLRDRGLYEGPVPVSLPEAELMVREVLARA